MFKKLRRIDMHKRSLILGIIALVTAFIPFICLVSPVIAIITIVTVIRGAKNEKNNLWNVALALAIISFPISILNSLVITGTGISYLVSRSVQESKYAQSNDIISAPPPEPLATYDLPSFSKTTSDAEPHFIKMTISLAYNPDPALNSELEDKKDDFQHIINLLVQGKTYEELNSTSGSITLAEEIKAHINMMLISGKIKEIYFKEFVVN